MDPTDREMLEHIQGLVSSMTAMEAAVPANTALAFKLQDSCRELRDTIQELLVQASLHEIEHDLDATCNCDNCREVNRIRSMYSHG